MNVIIFIIGDKMINLFLFFRRMFIKLIYSSIIIVSVSINNLIGRIIVIR